MSIATQPTASSQVLNVPNQLTTARLGLSIVLFLLIGMGYYPSALAVFVLAASTDWLDGYWARKYGQVTTLGRILDPFVDKIIICGAFIFLVAVPDSGIKAWMAVVVVGRELLVTALRSYLEGEGADFSAQLSGKLKMVLQCLAVVLVLAGLSWATAPAWLAGAKIGSIWAAMALTVYSGLEYVLRAVTLLRR